MSNILSLLALALIDSTSIGTLVIPLALVIYRRRVDVRALAIYFGTLLGFYFVLGLVLMTGLGAAQDRWSGAANSEPVVWVQLIVGVVLLAWGVLSRTPEKKDISQVRRPSSLSASAMVLLGLGAGVAEAATMVPYLAALALMGSMDIGFASRIGILAVYCLVMILPALVLIAIAGRLGNRVWARLERFIVWAEREMHITLLWIAAIVGFYMVADAIVRFGWIG